MFRVLAHTSLPFSNLLRSPFTVPNPEILSNLGTSHPPADLPLQNSEERRRGVPASLSQILVAAGRARTASIKLTATEEGGGTRQPGNVDTTPSPDSRSNRATRRG